MDFNSELLKKKKKIGKKKKKFLYKQIEVEFSVRNVRWRALHHPNREAGIMTHTINFSPPQFLIR